MAGVGKRESKPVCARHRCARGERSVIHVAVEQEHRPAIPSRYSIRKATGPCGKLGRLTGGTKCLQFVRMSPTFSESLRPRACSSNSHDHSPRSPACHTSSPSRQRTARTPCSPRRRRSTMHCERFDGMDAEDFEFASRCHQLLRGCEYSAAAPVPAASRSPVSSSRPLEER